MALSEGVEGECLVSKLWQALLRRSAPELVWENNSNDDDPCNWVRILILFCFWMAEKFSKRTSKVYTTFTYVSYSFVAEQLGQEEN